MIRVEKKVFNKFSRKHLTLAVAESCTGGLVGHTLTNMAGASAFFLLGIAAYDNAAKTKILKVPPALIQKHGAVSAPVAAAMAKGVRRCLRTDYGLSITGIAGPGGGSRAKPVGLVYIGISTSTNTAVQKHLFKGSRLSIKKQACQTALKMLAQ